MIKYFKKNDINFNFFKICLRKYPYPVRSLLEQNSLPTIYVEWVVLKLRTKKSKINKVTYTVDL